VEKKYCEDSVAESRYELGDCAKRSGKANRTRASALGGSLTQCTIFVVEQ